MSLRISWEWQSAPEVRAAELSATWSRLTIEVDDIIATLVEERERSHGVRKGLDVPTYPLAEWIAINWWALNASAHRPGHAGVRLVAAGSGFPWPDITLRSDRGFLWVDVRQRDKDPEFVRFLAQGQAVLDAEQAVGEMARFVDSTVRRLEESGVSGTLLQEEWATIQGADRDESDFCLVAAAWGFDPFDLPADVSKVLVETDQILGDPVLLADLARAVDLASLSSAGEWLMDAKMHVEVGTSSIPSLGRLALTESGGFAPWRQGYRYAAQFRELLALQPTDVAPVEELIKISDVAGIAPTNVDALVRVTDFSAGIVMGQGKSGGARRFVGARALGRKVMESPVGLSLLTRGSRYADRVERAFAAEFLAPATGIGELLGGDYSEESQRRVAQQLRVSPQVIDYQVENQLAA